MKNVGAAALLFMVSHPAFASTVVTFETPTGRLESINASAGVATGTWSEAGFIVDWGFEDYSDITQAINGFTFLSECRGGCFGNGTGLRFTRPDGQPFSLRSIGILGTATSALGEAIFTPFDSSGNLDFASRVTEKMSVVYDNLTLDITRSGVTQRLYASSFYDTAFWTAAGGSVPVSNDGVLTFTGAARAALSNADAIEVSVGIGESYLDLIQRTRAYSDLSMTFSPAPPDCIWNCVVDGLGVFSFNVEFGNIQNWASAVATGPYTFDVGPAPVPLPASVFLLMTSILVLGARRRGQKT